MFFNIVENLLGSDDLISVRSRGQFSRPFTRVVGMQKEAQDALRAKEQELNLSLTRANERLRSLQEQSGGQNQKVLNRAVVDEINQIKEERQQIMKEVRFVRKQFRESIEGLGEELFVINTFFIPLVLIIGSVCFQYYRISKRKAKGE